MKLTLYSGMLVALIATAMADETTPAAGTAIKDPVCASVDRRLRIDAQSVRGLLTNVVISTEIRQRLDDELARVEEGIPKLPRTCDDSFRAVLPLNGSHERIFRVQAAAWRAAGSPALVVWQSGLWDPLSPVHRLPASSNSTVTVAMMRNEFRAGCFNISNAGDTDKTLKLRIVGMPGGENPSWITVHQVEWTDTKPGVPVAAALPEAARNGKDILISARSGLTRQVWLTFHSNRVRPGMHQGRIVLSEHDSVLEIPLSVRVYPLVFPDKPTLHLGGWDYTDTVGRFDITSGNRLLVVKHLREHLVDSPWATSAVLPAGTFDAAGRQTASPDTSRFDEWLRLWPKAARYCVFMDVRGEWAGAPMGTPQFGERVGTWIRFWARHAQRRGIKPGQLALLLVDEPTKPEQDEIILAWAKAVHAAKTGIKVWEDPTHVNPATANQEMLAACDVLCPNRPKFLSDPKVRDYYTRCVPPGAELAFYSCSGPMRLLDPYSYIRLQAWSCWQHGARSSYFWAFSDAGGGSSWNEYATKRAAYLPFFFDSHSLTAGKHMEAIRESAEDYEYLVMLRAAMISVKKDRASDSERERARKLLAEAAPRVLDAKGASALAWASPKDRSVADRVRVEILDLLTELRGR